MPDNHDLTFEAQLRAAARDIVTTDLSAVPAVDPEAATAAIIAAASAPAAAISPAPTHQPRRFALWPTIAAAAVCLAIGYILPHPAPAVAEDPVVTTARAERSEVVVHTDTIYRERIVRQTVERIVERPVVQTVEVVRVDTVRTAIPAAQPKHAPRSLANDGFIYAYNTTDE